MPNNITPIIESNNFIVLDKYTNIVISSESYQTEAELEKELINDLINQGYEYRKDIDSTESMLNNLRTQIENLNKTTFQTMNGCVFVVNILIKQMILL